MKHIDDLPVYVWPIIFKNLSINDLLKCRLVNKKFKDFCNFTEGIIKLSIGEYSYDDIWNLNSEPIEEEDVISFARLQMVKLLSIFNLDKNIKFLRLNDDQFKFKELNYFINLEYLQIDLLPFSSIYQTLDLKNLKSLIISRRLYYEINLITPKLEKMKVKNLLAINFQSNPKTIKHIITICYVDRLKLFENLEIIELKKVHDLDFNKLSIFKKLKKFNINSPRITTMIINDIFNNLERNFEFYFYGFKIENKNIFRQLNRNELVAQINNYDLIDFELYSIINTEMCYDRLEPNIINIPINLLSNFFKLNSCLTTICINKNIEDIDRLKWFIKNLKNLRVIKLKNVLLDQDFFNNLPFTIRVLDINATKRFDIYSFINYDFILNFSKLSCFILNYNIDLFDLALSSYLNLKYLEYFSFKFNNKGINISKLNEKEFCLKTDKEIGRKKLDFKQLSFDQLKILFIEIKMI